MTKFKLSDLQAQAILDMQLKRLAALERRKIEDELKMVRETIAYLTDLLAHPEKILFVIREELQNVKKLFADERRTKVYKQQLGQFSDEDLIPNEEVIVTISKTGYIKRLQKGTFKVQRRGGKGVIGMTTKEQDMIEHLIIAETHDILLFFTNKGRVFLQRGWEIPETSRQAKGTAIINLLNIEQGELIQSVLSVSSESLTEKNVHCIFMATKRGVVKQTKLSDFRNIKSSGIIAIRLDAGDELVWVHETTKNDEIMLVTYKGKVIRFPSTEVRETGRATRGVTGIALGQDDYVVRMECIRRDPPPADKRRAWFKDLLVVTERGLGKRTNIDEFRGQHRGGKGIKVANITAKTGNVADALIITQDTEQLIISSKKGQVIKLPMKNIPRLSRNTQGVILMRFTDSSEVVSTATGV